MNWVGDNNDIRDPGNLDSLINTISDSKEFGFIKGDANSMIKSFFDMIGIWVDVCNESSNIISDTCVWNNNGWVGAR